MADKRKRTRFVASGNQVTVIEENYVGEIETTTYFVTSGEKGGYVRVRDAAGHFPQVCDGLHSRGPTLWATVDTLADVIRREYRRGREQERRAITHGGLLYP